MALTLANRVRETTTTTGTGTVTLAGAVTGYQSFSVIGNANTTYYTISGQGTSEFEVGIGTYTLSGTTLSRDTVLASSNAGSAVNFSAGTKDVFVTYPSNKAVYLDASSNVTLPGTLVGPASATVFNTVSTTVNAFGAATTLNIGAATGTLTVANTTLAAKAITASTTLGVTGASTLAALSATTGAFSGQLTNTVGGTFFVGSGATTGQANMQFSNTGGGVVLGIESSAGGTLITGSSAYAGVIYTSVNRSLQVGVNGAKVASFDSTGLAVTGTLSATSTLSTTGGAAKAEAAASQAKSVVGGFNSGAAAAASAEILTFAQAGTQKISHFWANSTTAYQIQTLASGAKIQLMPDTGGTVVADVTSTGLAVTGTLTATGTAAIGSTSFSGSQLYVTGTFGATAGITDAAIEVYVDDDGSTPKSGDRIGVKSVLNNVGRTTGKTAGLFTTVAEIDLGTCYGTYSKASGLYGQQYAVYGEVDKNLAAGTAGYCFYGKATTTSSGGQVFYLFGDDNGTTRISAGQNGGLSNYQANDINLSDRREKKDFAPAKSYLDVICAIPVQTFRYIDQKDDDLNLGVIAQDVQAVAPELVVESDWAAPDQESKVRLSVYQTDLQFALMKAIQELAAKVAKLEAA